MKITVHKNECTTREYTGNLRWAVIGFSGPVMAAFYAEDRAIEYKNRYCPSCAVVSLDDNEASVDEEIPFQ